MNNALFLLKLINFEYQAFINNNDNGFLGFAEMMLSVDEYRSQASKSEFAVLAKGVSSLMSTTKASVKQMSEYMDAIDKYYYAQGYALPKPDDYMWIRGE